MRAMNRNGDAFEKEEIVKMVDSPVLYEGMLGENLQIVDIKTWDTCESGFMIKAKHVESGKEFNKWLDTNWFQKIK